MTASGPTADLRATLEVLISSGSDLPQLRGALVIGIATWSGSENGASMQETLERWLVEGDDEIKVGLSLEGSDVLPFRDPATARAVLEAVASRMPEHADRCRRLIAARERYEHRGRWYWRWIGGLQRLF